MGYLHRVKSLVLTDGGSLVLLPKADLYRKDRRVSKVPRTDSCTAKPQPIRSPRQRGRAATVAR
jgi:hypothetical protein